MDKLTDQQTDKYIYIDTDIDNITTRTNKYD